jgi:PilZ domain
MDNLQGLYLQQAHNDDVLQDSLGWNMANIAERRDKPRLDCDYPAIVKGIDQQGKKYKDNGKLINLSASGLYLWVNRDIENNSKLSVTVLLSNILIDKDTPKLATEGIVIRNEPQTNGTYGIALKLSHYRFL